MKKSIPSLNSNIARGILYVEDVWKN